MVFGYQSKPDQTYSELCQSSTSLGVKISSQGMEQRMTAEAAEFMYQFLEGAIQQVIFTDPVMLPVLQRFHGVHLRDSSVVSLPEELKEIWPGVGGSAGETASVKLQVSLNYATGQLYGPVLQSGRTHDQKSPFHDNPLPAGALRLADLGFFDLDQLAQDGKDGIYWLTRLKTGTVIYSQEMNPIDLLPWLRSLVNPQTEVAIYLGKKQKIPCRLIVQRTPQEVADQRRCRLKEAARKKQTSVSPERYELAQWTLLVTNVPEDLLSVDEAPFLLRIRWQIELLFKLWKSYARIDEWRSKNPWRILCELYAKLIGVVITHWIQLLGLWQCPERSLFKSIKVIQKFAPMLEMALQEENTLNKVLSTILDCLQSGCKIDKRKSHPSTYQTLLCLS
jgi:hypothetical protein